MRPEEGGTIDKELRLTAPSIEWLDPLATEPLPLYDHIAVSAHPPCAGTTPSYQPAGQAIRFGIRGNSEMPPQWHPLPVGNKPRYRTPGAIRVDAFCVDAQTVPHCLSPTIGLDSDTRIPTSPAVRLHPRAEGWLLTAIHFQESPHEREGIDSDFRRCSRCRCRRGCWRWGGCRNWSNHRRRCRGGSGARRLSDCLVGCRRGWCRSDGKRARRCGRRCSRRGRRGDGGGCWCDRRHRRYVGGCTDHRMGHWRRRCSGRRRVGFVQARDALS